MFIPVGINYDRVLEDRTLLRKLDAAAPRARRRSTRSRGRAAFVAGNLWLMLTGRWYRFGYACVNFGTPISMRDYVGGAASTSASSATTSATAEVERVGAQRHGGDRAHHPGAAGVAGRHRVPAQPRRGTGPSSS